MVACHTVRGQLFELSQRRAAVIREQLAPLANPDSIPAFNRALEEMVPVCLGVGDRRAVSERLGRLVNPVLSATRPPNIGQLVSALRAALALF